MAGCQLPDVVAFKSRAFDEAITYEGYEASLHARGIERAWEFCEFGPAYEEDLTLFEPYYNGAEGYLSSGDWDWIIYASHESSVTVGGWLLAELKGMWPSWQRHVWSSVFD